MDTIEYLKDTYGYGVPIFLRKIRIGGRSKTAIRQDLSRAVRKGEINRSGNGIYYFTNETLPSFLLFEDIVKKKFIKNDYGIDGLDLEVYGYFSGETFVNLMHISQQVPAILEITTNNTSCQRIYELNGRKALLRRGRTDITRYNYKALQFFDMICSNLSEDEVEENLGTLTDYISEHLTKKDYLDNIKFYPNRVNKIIIEKGLINAFR